MVEHKCMPSIELFVFENREQLLGVRMSMGDKKPQRVILTEVEAAELMIWLGGVSQRVAGQERTLAILGLKNREPLRFDVDLLRDKL